MLTCHVRTVNTGSCPTGSLNSFNASIGDTITLRCTVNYTGSAVPVLQWSDSDAVPSDCSSSGTVCSSLSVKVQPRMTIIESYSCTVTSPPTVRDQCSSWTSTRITVSCTWLHVAFMSQLLSFFLIFIFFDRLYWLPVGFCLGNIKIYTHHIVSIKKLRGTTHITVILTCFTTECRKCFASPAINMYVYSPIR